MTILELVLGSGLVAIAVVAIIALFNRTGDWTQFSTPNDEKTQRERLRREVVSERRRIIQDIERERGTKVITLIHRREPWYKEGEPGYITIEDTEHILREIRRTPGDKPIDVILHTPGGLALAAEMIATALHEHPPRCPCSYRSTPCQAEPS